MSKDREAAKPTRRAFLTDTVRTTGLVASAAALGALAARPAEGEMVLRP